MKCVRAHDKWAINKHQKKKTKKTTCRTHTAAGTDSPFNITRSASLVGHFEPQTFSTPSHTQPAQGFVLQEPAQGQGHSRAALRGFPKPVAQRQALGRCISLGYGKGNGADIFSFGCALDLTLQAGSCRSSPVSVLIYLDKGGLGPAGRRYFFTCSYHL